MAMVTFGSDGGPAVSCTVCSKRLTETFYEVNRKTTCQDCAYKLQSRPRTTVGTLATATLVGSIGCAISAIAMALCHFYPVFYPTSPSWVISAINAEPDALLAGIVVGLSVRVGARGHVGKTFSFLAFALTYFSFSLAMTLGWLLLGFFGPGQPTEGNIWLISGVIGFVWFLVWIPSKIIEGDLTLIFNLSALVLAMLIPLRRTATMRGPIPVFLHDSQS